MNIELIKCPLNKWTFKPQKIKLLIESMCGTRVLNLFCGETKLDVEEEVRNDLDINLPNIGYNDDAFNLVQYFQKDKQKFNTIILDPPYSYRKSMELYKGHKNSRFKLLKDILPLLLEKGGNVITCGYQSISMGINRGFVLKNVYIISHGGAQHDTIITNEVKGCV